MTLLNLSPLLVSKQKATAHRLRKSGLSNDIAQPMGSLLSYIRLAINNDRFRGERGRITARRGYVERFCVSTLSPHIYQKIKEDGVVYGEPHAFPPPSLYDVIKNC